MVSPPFAKILCCWIKRFIPHRSVAVGFLRLEVESRSVNVSSVHLDQIQLFQGFQISIHCRPGISQDLRHVPLANEAIGLTAVDRVVDQLEKICLGSGNCIVVNQNLNERIVAVSFKFFIKIPFDQLDAELNFDFFYSWVLSSTVVRC